MENEKKTSKKSIKSTISSILTILLVVLIVFMIVRILVCKSKGEVYFLFNKYAAVYVVSGSMEPGIPIKSYILIEKADGDSVEVGDVITFKSSDPSILGQLNTHRITQDNGTTFQTKGDNNLAVDSYAVEKDNVVGKYVKNLTLITKITTLFSSLGGLIFAALLILSGTTITIVRIFKTPDEEPTKESKEDTMEKRIQAEIERLKAEEKAKGGNDENEPKGKS